MGNVRGKDKCPYCSSTDCVWTLSVASVQAAREVHTTCGHSLSADSLLGKSRWHLEAAQKATEVMRCPSTQEATQSMRRAPAPNK